MRAWTSGATRVALTVGSISALAMAVFVANAGAGVVPTLDAPLTVVKTVSGPVPAATTFTAQIHCDSAIIDTDDGNTDTATVTFDSSGQPTSPDTVGFDDPGSCTVTETASGGAASTTYACESSVIDDSESAFPSAVTPDSPVCVAAGPSATPLTVNIVDPDQSATITIANTFTAVTPTPVVQPAAAVAAAPAFTG
jgi:hypothetical protein